MTSTATEVAKSRQKSPKVAKKIKNLQKPYPIPVYQRLPDLRHRLSAFPVKTVKSASQDPTLAASAASTSDVAGVPGVTKPASVSAVMAQGDTR